MNVSIGERWEEFVDVAGLPGLLGTAGAELRADIRSLPFRGYVMFFRYLGDSATFEVVNIREGHLDIEVHFQGRTGEE